MADLVTDHAFVPSPSGTDYCVVRVRIETTNGHAWLACGRPKSVHASAQEPKSCPCSRRAVGDYDGPLEDCPIHGETREQAYARGAADERARIVRWPRKQTVAISLDWYADRIEAGRAEHG